MPINRKPRKRQNGTGNSITLNFDQSDPQELEALHMAKRLAAMKHGKRKDLIIALLAAMERHYAATGEILSPTAVTNALLQPPVNPYAAPHTNVPPREPMSSPRIVIQSVPNRVDANAVASSFASSLAGFLG